MYRLRHSTYHSTIGRIATGLKCHDELLRSNLENRFYSGCHSATNGGPLSQSRFIPVCEGALTNVVLTLDQPSLLFEVSLTYLYSRKYTDETLGVRKETNGILQLWSVAAVFLWCNPVEHISNFTCHFVCAGI